VLCIVGIVFSYGALMVAVELPYKDSFSSMLLWDKPSMAGWKGKETLWIGVVTLFSMAFMGTPMLTYCGWKVTALFTPVVTGIVGSFFYILALFLDVAYPGIIFKADFDAEKSFPGGRNVNVVVYMGLILCVCAKSFKYATFDPTKEMAYLPLTKSEKNKAKAIVDVVGARAGKSIGSLFNILLASITGLEGKALTQTFFSISFFFFVINDILWIICAIFLDGYIKKREKKNELECKMDKEESK